MARLIWTKNAVSDLNEISGYIALDNRSAAKRLAKRVYSHVKQLISHPLSGSFIPETENLRYRQIIEGPCRIFYEVQGDMVIVLHVIRSERTLRIERLEKSE